MSKLSNLEKIKAAWAMRYSAKLSTSNFVVVSVGDSTIAVRNMRSVKYFTSKQTESMKITGYLYAGELAGNDPIPEGQKFRVKETGEIMIFKRKWKRAIDLIDETDADWNYGYEEIEPIFE